MKNGVNKDIKIISLSRDLAFSFLTQLEISFNPVINRYKITNKMAGKTSLRFERLVSENAQKKIDLHSIKI